MKTLKAERTEGQHELDGLFGAPKMSQVLVWSCFQTSTGLYESWWDAVSPGKTSVWNPGLIFHLWAQLQPEAFLKMKEEAKSFKRKAAIRCSSNWESSGLQSQMDSDQVPAENLPLLNGDSKTSKSNNLEKTWKTTALNWIKLTCWLFTTKLLKGVNIILTSAMKVHIFTPPPSSPTWGEAGSFCRHYNNLWRKVLASQKAELHCSWG